MPPEPRTHHPFYMYDAVAAQPAAFAEVVGRARPIAQTWAQHARHAQRLVLVGTGTSLHAAHVGVYLLRHYGVDLPIEVWPAFDFALYGPPLTSEDNVVLLSHRGTKRYGIAALQRARAAGCATTLITGQGPHATPDAADVVIATTVQDPSSAHTISYTGAIAALATLAEALGSVRTDHSPYPSTFLAETIPNVLQRCLTTEPLMLAFAGNHRDHRRIWLVGGGPSAVTAQEIALKIKETSYLQAEGMSIEAMLHGPFQSVDEQDLFILIAPQGAAQERVLTLAPMIAEVGAPAFLVSDTTSLRQRDQPQVTDVCQVETVPEPFTALTCVVPLQLLTYHLALACGTNPDGFRLDDPRFARAATHTQL